MGERISDVPGDAGVKADLAWKTKYEDPAGAIELAEEAIELAGKTGEDGVLVKALLSKAMGLAQKSRFREAEASAMNALDICRILDDRQRVLHALNVLGSVRSSWGLLEEALDNYMDSQDLHIELKGYPDPGVLSNIGGIYLQLGDTEKALECYLEVLEAMKDMEGPADLRTASMLNMGEVYSRLCMFEDALAHLYQALESSETGGMVQASATIHESIGVALAGLGRCDEAMVHFEKGLEGFRSLEDRRGEAFVLSKMGQCLIDNDMGKAEESYGRSLEIFRSLQDARGVVEALIGTARVLHAEGGGDSLAHFSEAMELASLKGLKPQLAQIHEELSRIFESRGDFEKALMHSRLRHELDVQVRSAMAESRLGNIRLSRQLDRTRREVFVCRLKNARLERERRRLENAYDPIEDAEDESVFIDELEEPGAEEAAHSADPEFRYVSPGGSPPGGMVLAVEDDPEVAEMIIEALERNGYGVTVCSSVRAAEEVLENESWKVGCVFVDVRLPDGSGLDLIRRIRERSPAMPLLAGSGYPLPGRDMDYLNENRIGFIAKPYSIDTLILNMITMLPDLRNGEHEQ